ncbi:SDR family oxidoreductase [Microbacterium sp. 2FI]|uniref:SDR family oxidoreductase n=1 Tax=Microbacterium sp. 2FI TaxID=2502193 RepID=UPI0010F63005|nr:SDR family oxidoreductase [Microbacterium sp. 2FI]
MSNENYLVVGASGVTGGAIARQLSQSGRMVTALSRSGPRTTDSGSGQLILLGDLSVPDGVPPGSLTPITHVVYAAYVEGANHAATTNLNAEMFRNLLTGLDRDGADVAHIQLIGGGKSYGEHLGPYRTPAKETDPRILGPILYNPQEDAMREWVGRRGATFTVLRPDGVIGFGARSPMNILSGVAAFAMLSKSEGVPLRFPGSWSAWRALHQATDARILARAVEWAFTAGTARNETFNVTNGDHFRWCHLWPTIAEFFDMPCAEPQPLDLEAHMIGRDADWVELTTRQGLRETTFPDFVAWPFVEGWWRTEFDMVQSTIKIRQAGFADCIDSHQSFLDHLSALRDDRFIS